MFSPKKVGKPTTRCVFVILLLIVFKPNAADNNLQVDDDEGELFATTKADNGRGEDNEQNVEDDDSKFDKIGKKPSDKDDNGQVEQCNSIYGKPESGSSKHEMDGSKQSSDEQEDKRIDDEENDNLSGQKKSAPKDNNRVSYS